MRRAAHDGGVMVGAPRPRPDHSLPQSPPTNRMTPKPTAPDENDTTARA